MPDNEFEIEILSDGNIKVTSPGGFSRQYHKKADEFLELLKKLMGGEQVEIAKLPRPTLANPQDVSSTHTTKPKPSL